MIDFYIFNNYAKILNLGCIAKYNGDHK